MTRTVEEALPFPDDAGPRCDACKGRGWIPGDCHPREVCGTCNGTGYPKSWAAEEIARLDREIARLRAAPARDDRGAERIVDRLVRLVSLYRGTEDLDALREEFRCVLAFVPRPSGEATALREALRECTYLLKCAASGSPALDVPRAYAAVRDAQRALAASPSRPSQPCENEFHADACDGSRQDCHPVASPSQPEKEEHHG
jgi:hypothetical protein